MKKISRTLAVISFLTFLLAFADVYAQGGSDTVLSDKLILASKEGDISKVKSILALGVDINAYDNFKNTPLHWAVLEGHSLLVEYLLQHGADINAKDEDGTTPLHKAVGKGNILIVQSLILHSADVNTQTDEGVTPLLVASLVANVNIAKILLDSGASPNPVGFSRSPLIIATEKGNKDLTDLLIFHGAAIGSKDEQGFTPLHWAAYMNHRDLIKVLLAHGADLEAKENNGYTALEIARLKNNTSASKILEENKRVNKTGIASGQEDLETADRLNQQVEQIYNEGRYQEAIPLAERALAIWQKVLGTEHPSVATSQNNLGLLYHDIGDYGRAEPLYQRSLAIREKILGPEHPHVANSLNNLAELYREMGDYDQAESLYHRALAILQKVLGSEHPHVATSLNNLGLLYYDMGDYGRAEPLYQRALAIRQKDLDPEHLDVATSLNNLGLLYYAMGEYGRAEPLYQRSLGIREKGLMPEHPNVATSLNNLAELYREMGDYARAEPLYQRSLAIREKVLGSEHPDVATSLNNLAALYHCIGDYDRAEPLYQRALAIREKALGPEHPHVKEAKGNIGFLYLAQGKLDEAYEIFEEGEKRGWSTGLGTYHLFKRNLQEAARHFELAGEYLRKRRSAHLVGATIGLGLAREGLNQYAEAAKAFEQAMNLIEEQRTGLDPGSKTHFLSGLEGIFKRIEAYEGLVRVKATLQDPAEAFFSSEHTKARALLDALPRGKTAGVLPSALFQREQELTTKLRGLYKQREAAFGKNPELFQQIDEHDLPQARQELARFVETLRKKQPLYAAVNYPQPLPVSQIKLNAGESLIAYEVTDETTLGWLVRDGKIITSVSIPISRKDLTQKITSYRKCFENVEKHDELAQFDPHLGKQLYDLLFKPFADHLTPIAPLIIVPDEILGILPFETLVADHPQQITWQTGQYGPVPQEITYLGDMFPISYNQSATTLTLSRTLQSAVVLPSNRMLVLTDPVFDLNDARLEKQSILLAQKPDEYQMHLRNAVAEGFKSPDAKPEFERLYATRQLGEKLGCIHGGSIEVLQGLDADEPNLRSRPLDQYSYQVFATHGILDNQIPYIQEPALMLSQVGVNPQVPEEDGFLTMSEVMGLRLQAQLVALTACSTGVGKRLTGEGVMGMGRAFQYAGAQSVLMSLWSVEDDSTNLLTERLFSHLKRGKSRMEAIQQARSDLRQAGYEHPFFWAPFILVGEQ